jgi:putative hemolysin
VPTTDVAIIALLLLVNGVFAMAEIAVVTARKVRLQQRAEDGDRRAAAALRLKEDPTEFLSTVQVGITFVGVFAGAYSATTLAEPIAVRLARFEAVAPYAEALSLVIVVGTITYLSLIFGELVPKAVALHDPERVAGLVAAPMAAVARVGAPLVRLLSSSTNLVLRVLRVGPDRPPDVTEEEIRALVKQAVQAGDVRRVEQEIVEQVFRLGDRRVGSIMTPRHEIDWLDQHESIDGIRAHLAQAKHPRMIVCDGEIDKVLGVAHAEDLLASMLAGRDVDLRPLLEPPLFVPATLSVFQMLETFRSSRVHLALVLDEFGAIEGIVTPTDILEGLVGEMPSEPAAAAGPIFRRDESSWLVDGAMPMDDLRSAIEMPPVPEAEQGTYHTLAGFVMTRLARIPTEGDRFEWGGLLFEVVDMDGRRVDKLLVERRSAGVEPS